MDNHCYLSATSARPATPTGPRLPGITSTGVGISHSAPAFIAPLTRPSRASLRTLRSDTPNRAAASGTVTLATSSSGDSDANSNSTGLGLLTRIHRRRASG